MMFADAAAAQPIDQTSMRIVPIHNGWTSEADLSIAQRIGDYYQQDASRTSFVSKRSALLHVNSTVVVIGHPALNIETLQMETGSNFESQLTVAVPFSKRLDTVQHRLGLSMTQLAQLFGVTRKSVYDWFDGSSPRPAVVQKTEALIDIINESPADIDITRLKTVWNIVSGDESFLALLKDESVPSSELKSKALAKINALGPRLGKAELSSERVRQPLTTILDIDRFLDV